MDKWRTKLVWLAAGIPTPRYRVVDDRHRLDARRAELGLPLIVKPAREGSTIGITKVTTRTTSCDAAYAVAAKHDRWCWSRSSSRARSSPRRSLGERALPLIRIEAPRGQLRLPQQVLLRRHEVLLPVRAAATKEERDPQALCARGLPRARLQRLGPPRPDAARRRPYSFLEVNTSPGMTGHSLVPMAAKRGRHVVRRPVRADPGGRACGMTPRSLNRAGAAPLVRHGGARARRCVRRAAYGCAAPALWRSARSIVAAPARAHQRRRTSRRADARARRHLLHHGPRRGARARCERLPWVRERRGAPAVARPPRGRRRGARAARALGRRRAREHARRGLPRHDRRARCRASPARAAPRPRWRARYREFARAARAARLAVERVRAVARAAPGSCALDNGLHARARPRRRPRRRRASSASSPRTAATLGALARAGYANTSTCAIRTASRRAALPGSRRLTKTPERMRAKTTRT